MKIDFLKLKNAFSAWQKRWFGGLPLVFLGIVMFFLAIAVGGSKMAAIAIALMFIASSLLQSNISVKMYLVYYATLAVCAMLGVVATMNYPLCIFLNLIVIFMITFINGDNFIVKNYFMYGFIFIMPQMTPLAPMDVLRCGLTCFVCFLAMSVFIFIWQKKHNIPKSDRYLEQACSLIALRLRDNTPNLGNTTTGESQLTGITKSFCNQIYGDVLKQYGKLNEGQNWQYSYLLYIEQIEHLFLEQVLVYSKISESNSAYFHDLALAFENAAFDKTQGRHERLGAALNAFMSTHAQDNCDIDKNWRIILNGLSSLCLKESLCCSKKVSLRQAFKVKLKSMKRNFHFQSNILRFSLKASVLIAMCFIISYPMNFGKSYWLPITLYSMLAVFHEDEKSGATSRLLGTVMGLIFFALVTEFIPGPMQIKTLIVLFLGFSLIFSFSDPKISVLIGTQMSVISLFPSDMTISAALAARFAIVLGAAVLIWLGGLLIFRTERKDALRFHITSLLYRYRSLTKELSKILESKIKNQNFNELLFIIQMYTYEIESLVPSADEKGQEELQALIIPNCQAFNREMFHMLLILRELNLSKEQKEHFVATISFLRNLLDYALSDFSVGNSAFYDYILSKKSANEETHLQQSSLHLHDLLHALHK